MKKSMFIYVVLIFISCQNSKLDNLDNQITKSDSSKPKVNTAIVNNNIALMEQSKKYRLKNDSLQIDVEFKKVDSLHIKFDMTVNVNHKIEKISGTAYLIRLEEDGKFYVPEGTSILDENTNKEYSCDSTYSYESKKINIGFGLEQKTRKRMSLGIDHSTLSVIKGHDYTLYKID